MKITDIEVITFRTPGGRSRPSKWGYGIWGEEAKRVGKLDLQNRNR